MTENERSRPTEPEITQNIKSQFSGWLFWDVDDLSLTKNRDFIILRVLNEGTDSDLRRLKELVSENDILNVVKTRRGLSTRTALFWANYYKIPYHQCKSLTM
jgi:hypothetical protein